MSRGCVLMSFLFLALPVSADVRVTFPEPGRYADGGLQPREVDRVTAQIEEHLQALGRRYLRPGENLAIEILDIDLAGELRYVPRRDVRVLGGGADWPRITLRYALETTPGTVRRGEETVIDRNYILNSARPGDSLAYEKRMLEEWFRARFANPR